MFNHVHITAARDLPDTGQICCMGAAVYGPGRCTCWEPVYDQEQREPDTTAPPTIATDCCYDCAFRAGSPERAGDDTYKHSGAGDLEDLAASGEGVFFCHQGMRRVVKYRHPCGMEIDAHPGEYDPACRGLQAYRADGRPADVCAGFASEWRRIQRKLREEASR